jgi:hypothetical protein
MVTGSPRSLTGAETSKNQNRYSIPITTDTADALETMPEDLDGYVRRRDETVAGVDGFLQNLNNTYCLVLPRLKRNFDLHLNFQNYNN